MGGSGALLGRTRVIVLGSDPPGFSRGEVQLASVRVVAVTSSNILASWSWTAC